MTATRVAITIIGSMARDSRAEEVWFLQLHLHTKGNLIVAAFMLPF
jgi:hypothetical protein